MQNAQDLFGMDWMEEFNLFKVPINTFFNKIDGTMMSSDKVKKKKKKELKIKFPEGLGFCSKVKAKFKVKENAMPVFRLWKSVPYVSAEIIDKELGRLEKLRVIEKNDYSPWAAPTIYLKKNIIKLESAPDYSIRLNDCLKQIITPSQQWEKFLQI